MFRQPTTVRRQQKWARQHSQLNKQPQYDLVEGYKAKVDNLLYLIIKVRIGIGRIQRKRSASLLPARSNDLHIRRRNFDSFVTQHAVVRKNEACDSWVLSKCGGI